MALELLFEHLSYEKNLIFRKKIPVNEKVNTILEKGVKRKKNYR